jgi:GNAT superfamily N-acetyltransferase
MLVKGTEENREELEALIDEARMFFKGSERTDGPPKAWYVSYFKDPETGELMALGVATVYDADRVRTKPDQFGEDLKYRQLWIDYVWTPWSGHGYGRKVLDELEAGLAAHAPEVRRKNIYLRAGVKTLGFYDKCGYTPIYTDTEHEDDPYDFGECQEWGALWLAKPILPGMPLDQEECSAPRLCALGGQTKARRSYYTVFNDPPPPMKDMIEFIENADEHDDEWLIAMTKQLKDQHQRENFAWVMGIKLAVESSGLTLGTAGAAE